MQPSNLTVMKKSLLVLFTLFFGLAFLAGCEPKSSHHDSSELVLEGDGAPQVSDPRLGRPLEPSTGPADQIRTESDQTGPPPPREIEGAPPANRGGVGGPARPPIHQELNPDTGSPLDPINSLPDVEFHMTTGDRSVEPILKDLSANVFSPNYPNLQWPPQPIISMTIESVSEGRSSISGGVRILRLGPNFTNSLLDSYKISFVMYGSMRRNQNRGRPEILSFQERDREAIQVENLRPELIFRNEASGLIYPKVEDGFPMIGLCKFEGRKGNEGVRGGGIESPIGGPSASRQTSTNIIISYETNYFPLNSRVAVLDYLYRVCADSFQRQVRPHLPSQLAEISDSVNMMTRGNIQYCDSKPANDITNGRTDQCTPGPNDGRSPMGDDQCSCWARRNFRPQRLDKQVPRCVFNTFDNGHRCELRSLEGNLCPLYYNARTGHVQGTHAGYLSEITVGSEAEKRCDYGLRCRLEGPLWMARFFRLSSAVCERPTP